ncbi:uncharacterized protein A4U43_C05F16320 [Asparagus officinalis]|uniref:Uncharacterized protein n=1 Tax=Asparagus officinalis TaxID=4686 RepID=A0A5P1ES86_ASPOF|nr:uncharacterized protein A4U43_C05F16320 [Asparagus officinalis]
MEKLLDVELRDLGRIQAYKGSRRWENLFNNDVLRAAYISSIPTTKADLARAVVISIDEQPAQGSYPDSPPVPQNIFCDNVEAEHLQIEVALGSTSGVATPESSHAPSKFIKVEGNFPHSVLKEEVRGEVIPVKELTGDEALLES